MPKPMNKAVFVDRDGTIIVNHDYLDNVAGVELLPDAGAGLQLLSEAGFLLVLITNQSGIGRGYFSGEVVEAQHRKLQKLLEPYMVQFAAVNYCPHAPENDCNCRKPKPGLILDAARRLNISLSQSYMIGDNVCDVEAGRSAGCGTVYVGQEDGDDADFQARDLKVAADWIISHSRSDS